jgi:hypothetical protein
VVRGGREDVKRLVIAPLCALDEIRDHSRPSSSARHLPHSWSMSVTTA